MPVLSMFFGVTVSMYFMDNRQHKRPHIHARYGSEEAVFAIPEGDVLQGELPRSKTKLVQAWIEIHRDELMRGWNLAVNGQHPPKIDPLK